MTIQAQIIDVLRTAQQETGAPGLRQPRPRGHRRHRRPHRRDVRRADRRDRERRGALRPAADAVHDRLDRRAAPARRVERRSARADPGLATVAHRLADACPFADRCPLAAAVCRGSEPPLATVDVAAGVAGENRSTPRFRTPSPATATRRSPRHTPTPARSSACRRSPRRDRGCPPPTTRRTGRCRPGRGPDEDLPAPARCALQAEGRAGLRRRRCRPRHPEG